MPTAAAPALSHSPTFSGVTPPVGNRRAWGNGARIDRMCLGEDKSIGGDLKRPRNLRHAMSVGAVDQNQQLAVPR